VRTVVVGASLAGVRTAQALRRRDPDGEVVLVGAEPGTDHGLATDRPPLSKAFLTDPSATAPPLLTEQALTALGVTVLAGRAVDLDTAAGAVTLHGGQRLDYDALVVATGSTPRTLPGLEPRAGVHAFRTAQDAQAVRSAGGHGVRVVVVGGGFIGGEIASSMRAIGREVSVVEPLPALMLRGLGPVLGAVFSRRHRAAGAELHLGVGVADIEGGSVVHGVRLTDGRLLPADVVVLGLGTVPETAWLRDSGLDVRDGVVCDEHLAARGAEGVWAAGDVARWAHPRYGEDVRVEHWTNAVESAAVVAAGICGTPTVHAALPYVWSEQLGGRLQILGRVRGQDELRVVHGDLDGEFVAVTGGAGGLQAVVGYGAVKPLLPWRKLLLQGAGWDEALATV